MTTETIAAPTVGVDQLLASALEYFPDASVTHFFLTYCLAQLTEDHLIIVSDHDTEPALALAAMPASYRWGCVGSESIGDALVCHFAPC